jgi:hypothetical protein
MYRGLVPNIMRNSLMNMAELVTYDVTKTTLLSFGIADGLPVHALSGTCRVVLLWFRACSTSAGFSVHVGLTP